MSEKQSSLVSEWPELLERIRVEFVHLSAAEQQWLRERMTAIEEIQSALDGLFRRAGGSNACAHCDGECCGCGRHHITLTNLLAYLLAGENPPAPDFSKTCPYLGETGCLLPVARRPYNCITFFCDQLEERLGEAEKESLRELDQKLRREYLAVAERFPAASLRGLWIALENMGDGRILRSN